MSANLLRRQWRQLSEGSVRRLQAQQLSRYLRSVVLPFSAHYRRVFEEHGLSADSFGDLQDLQRVPLASKVDLLNTPAQPQRFKDWMLAPDAKALSRRPSTMLRAIVRGRQAVRQELESEFRPIFVTFTTGRSAEPTPFFYTQRDLMHLATAGARLVEICAARPEDRMLNTFPFAPHLAFWLAHCAGTNGRVLTLSSGGGRVMGTGGNLRHLRKMQPEVLIGIPTFIYHLLHRALEEGVTCENLRCIVLGGERVSEGLRHKLRDLAVALGARRVDVLATYGFTEAKLAWPECPSPHEYPSSGYHLYPDLGIMEVIDPKTGQVLPPGRPGELVYTPLDARGTVVLRYRTGDYIDGGLCYEPCPYCGRTLPRLLGNISRSTEVKQMTFDKIKGTLVDFNELEQVLDEAPHVGAWQVELRKVNNDPLELDEVVLHVHKVNGVDEEQLSRELSERCFARLEIHPNRILYHSAEEIGLLQGLGKLLKEQKLVDNRPPAAPTRQAPVITGHIEVTA